MGWLKPVEVKTKRLWIDGAWKINMALAGLVRPSAADFCRRVENEVFDAQQLLRVLPSHNAIYFMVPRVGSTRIRRTLGLIGKRYSRRLNPRQWGKLREAQGLRTMTPLSFYRLATNPHTFRFSFVRNPYERLLSAWAGGFQDVPLVPGKRAVDDYLAWRDRIDASLPAGPDRTLSFEQFTVFVLGRLHVPEQHYMPQDRLLTVPGIPLDFVGRMENFNDDFAMVLDRLGATAELRRDALLPVNTSRHRHWADYYTPALADRVYRAYQRDFDRFRYPRAVPAR